MWEALKKAEARFAEITDLLGKPEVASDPRKLRDLSRERSRLDVTMTHARRLPQDGRRRSATTSQRSPPATPSWPRLAQAELPELRERLRQARSGAGQGSLLPRDPDDDKNVIVEIRAGTGGAEASLFAADLYRMYTKFAERRGWKQEVMSSSPSEVGGFKEIIFSLDRRVGVPGDEVRERRPPRAARARHRGLGRASTPRRPRSRCCPRSRRWTSQVEEKDLRVDVYRAGGPGGQGVNTTDSGGAHHAPADAGWWSPARTSARRSRTARRR